MINETRITTATSALGSVKLDKIAPAEGEIPVNSQLSMLNAQLCKLPC